MNLARWATLRTPSLMFLLLGLKYQETEERKHRLFSVACWRRVFDMLEVDACRTFVEAHEAFADEQVEEEDLLAARAAVEVLGTGRSKRAESFRERTSWLLRFGVRFSPDSMSFGAAEMAAFRTDRRLSTPPDDPGRREIIRLARREETRAHADLLRDIFGNPFQPRPFDPSWLTWKGGTIPDLAEAIYEAKAFDRMPILGDALEEAGCTDEDILNHCRSGGEHVRGCWVVDAILGRS